MNSVRLNNALILPDIGFGTYKLEDNTAGEAAVSEALRCGYRLFDTASYYKNEAMIGRAVHLSGIPRNTILLASKLWNDEQGYANAKAAFSRTLDHLQTDYLDIYLIHWPIPRGQRAGYEARILETFRAMEELYRAGKIRALGVCNFRPHHLRHLVASASVLPMINQIEIRPYCQQQDVVDYCHRNHIVVQAWSPLGRGKEFSDPVLMQIAQRHQKSVPQIILRWHIQRGVLPIPKAARPEKMVENRSIYDFTLSEEEMNAIRLLDRPGSMAINPDAMDRD